MIDRLSPSSLLLRSWLSVMPGGHMTCWFSLLLFHMVEWKILALHLWHPRCWLERGSVANIVLNVLLVKQWDTGASLRAGIGQIDLLWGHSYILAQFRLFRLPVKTSCPPTDSVTETFGMHSQLQNLTSEKLFFSAISASDKLSCSRWNYM